MEIIDSFLEKSKNKFLNNLIKIPKQYDWYLGLVIHMDSDDIITDEQIKEKCNEVYPKSEKHIQLLDVTYIDGDILLIFGTDPIPFNSNIKGIIKSICKYLGCKNYDVTFMKYFKDMIFDAWGEQKYHFLICDNKAYDLTFLKGE